MTGIVQEHNTIQTTSGSVVTDVLSGIAAGNLLHYFAIALFNQSFTGVPTDTQGNTYIAIGSPLVVSTNILIGQWYVSSAIGGVGANTASVGLGFAHTLRTGILREIGPGIAASPLDGSNTGTGSSTSAVTGSATNTNPAFMSGFAWTHDGSGLTAAGGASNGQTGLVISGASGLAITAQKVIAAGGSPQTLAATVGVSDTWGIVMAMFDVASGLKFRKTLSTIGTRAGARQLQG